jgi:type II secretory pathway pseudopilin PulG
VVSIIALLAGLLLPAVHTVQKMAKETKQKAQLTSIELGLAAFKNDYGDYPQSSFTDSTPGGTGNYCGAQKLTEALLGLDLLGFHPNSNWRADGRTVNSQGVVTDAAYTAANNLTNRRDRYIELDTANAFFLGGGMDGVYLNTAGEWNGALAPRTYVLCDVFPVRERKLRLADGRIVSPGMPILYYKANPASKILVPGANQGQVAPEARVYNARDNWALVSLGMLADNAKPLTGRRRHKLDALYPLNPEEVSRLYNTNDSYFTYFYQLYLRDPRVQAQPWPYRPDSFVLISAGADGIYGTNDDIRNFGQ